MNQIRSGWMLAILSTIIFSTNTPIARSIILDAMDPMTLVVTRFVLAALLFAIVLRLTPLGTPSADEKPLDRRIVLICLTSGAINGITLTCWYSALRYLDAAMASVLGIALFPTMTLLFLALRGEPFTRKKVLRLAVVMVGLYFLIGIGDQLNARGLLFVIGAATTYALHLVSVQWFMQAYNTWATTALMMAGGAIVVVILWLWSGAPTYVPGWRGWLVIAYQVVILTFIGRTVIYAAIDRIGSGQVALLTPIETVLTIVWSALFLGELLTPTQSLGAVLILLSALLAAEWKRNRSTMTPIPSE